MHRSDSGTVAGESFDQAARVVAIAAIARQCTCRPVGQTDHPIGGIEKTQVFGTTSAIFGACCLLIAYYSSE